MTNPQNTPPPKELTCDEYISYLENQLKNLKNVRQQFLQKKMIPPQYEEETMKCLRQLQYGIDGVRHTFLPLVIPSYLQISITPPSWIKLSPIQISEYANYSIQNDIEQKEMLRKFRRPGMRRADIQRAAQILNIQQNKTLELMKWNQSNFLCSILSNSLRPKVVASDNYSPSLLKLIKCYIDENSLDYPVNDDAVSLLMISLFDDDGPLADGYPKTKTVQQEVSVIATTLCKLSYGYPIEKMVGNVISYIADLRHDQLLQPLEKTVADINKVLKDAIDILGSDATMADFGTEGVSSLLMTDSLKKANKSRKVDKIASYLQEAGQSALDEANSKTAAANMIAAALISENLVNIPLNFMYAITWCSDSLLTSFTNQPLYLQAFDALLHVLPDFGE
ncbi:hypothetical protein TRFO_01271 [Tritrichomonas foetus]|uniref:Uncharacterized protein n=1 Tax=Tritrichomonas foetus TaxID=1144522 RepID=A0A1J4K701_9EUKA|nr:hypothetical protein TRFO_01271 [Tritrichomonas foetus]|eukprot:OHT07151.1 hypothetical protein TRFO_01271 [Tritrichomonas foetus]